MNSYSTTQAIVLAAGKSTRFKMKKSKLLAPLCGQPVITYPVKTLFSLGIPITLVVGHQAEEIQEELMLHKFMGIQYVTQHEQRGTGHAISLSANAWFKDNILILCGDTPLLSADVLTKLIHIHQENKSILSFCTSIAPNPTGYGRVIEANGCYEIVEEKHCSAAQKSIQRINSGIYLINRLFLKEFITKIEVNPITGEYYLTDLIKQASDAGVTITCLDIPYNAMRGINTLQELSEIESLKRAEIIQFWMQEGVHFEFASTTHIDITVSIGTGSSIGAGSILKGGTIVGKNCIIGPYSIIENSEIKDNSTIHSHSVIQNSLIGSQSTIGPFARLREKALIGDDVKLGNFVEVKSSTIGSHTRAKHLTFLGNAHIGESVNIGAGTITCNYDGKNKHTTTIQDKAFIGSNNTLIAPLTIEKEAYTAAGSTINKNVPSQSLAIARARQENKEGHAKKIKEKHNSFDSHSKKDDLSFVSNLSKTSLSTVE